MPTSLRNTRGGAKRDKAVAKWHEIEKEARYGYSVRTQHGGAAWDGALEHKLETEWDQLRTGKSWNDSKPGVRLGWEYVGKHEL